MTTRDAHPTRDELLAMAYVDGELERGAQAEFHARVAREPALARLVVEYQRIELAARQAAPPEPMDHEWRRLSEDGVQQAGLGAGWFLLAAGGIGLAGWVSFEVLRSDLPALVKLLLAALALGFTILFLLTLRGRLRTLPYDPYTKVER